MSATAITDTRQYLTFRLDDGIFGLDVCHVREILEFTTVTKVPGLPDYMRGVINLRGNAVPVLDMRLKFGLGKVEKRVGVCVVVVEVRLKDENVVIGALVDSVQEVLELAPDQIEPAPKIGSQLRTDFIRGMSRKDDGFVILLDVNKIFSSEELSSAKGTGEGEMKEIASNQ